MSRPRARGVDSSRAFSGAIPARAVRTPGERGPWAATSWLALSAPPGIARTTRALRVQPPAPARSKRPPRTWTRPTPPPAIRTRPPSSPLYSFRPLATARMAVNRRTVGPTTSPSQTRRPPCTSTTRFAPHHFAKAGRPDAPRALRAIPLPQGRSSCLLRPRAATALGDSYTSHTLVVVDLRVGRGSQRRRRPPRRLRSLGGGRSSDRLGIAT